MGFLFHYRKVFFRRIITGGITKIILTGIFIIFFQFTTARQKQFLFTNIDKSQVLSHNHIPCFLKDRHPEQLIIAQTAYARTEDEILFRQEGFDDYLSKPICYGDQVHILEKSY